MSGLESRSVFAAARSAGWFRLRVAAVERLSGDAVAVALDVPETVRESFVYRAGQHIEVRHVLAGREKSHRYSLCPPRHPDSGLRIVVKRLGTDGLAHDGAHDSFSHHATTALAPGDHLEVSTPTGGFRLADRPGAHHVMIAGGSGITPLLSMAAAALRDDPRCRVSTIYANRASGSTLLADDLAELKDAYLDRFSVLHVLSRERGGAELLTGRIDAARLRRLLVLLGARPGADTYFYLCGPSGLLNTVHAALADWGAAPHRIRTERPIGGQATQSTDRRLSPRRP